MTKVLTKEMIFNKFKVDKLEDVVNLNVWGNDLEDVSIIKQMPNLEVISLSLNKIKTLKYFANCRKLNELYLRKNQINNISELSYLKNCENLKILWIGENKICETPNYRLITIKTLPQLVKLDNILITIEEKEISSKINDDLVQEPPKKENEKEFRKSKNNIFSSNDQYQIKEIKDAYLERQSKMNENDNFVVKINSESEYLPNINLNQKKNNLLSPLVVPSKKEIMLNYDQLSNNQEDESVKISVKTPQQNQNELNIKYNSNTPQLNKNKKPKSDKNVPIIDFQNNSQLNIINSQKISDFKQNLKIDQLKIKNQRHDLELPKIKNNNFNPGENQNIMSALKSLIKELSINDLMATKIAIQRRLGTFK